MSEPLNIHSVWEIDLDSANALNDCIIPSCLRQNRRAQSLETRLH